jgi:prepilin peptidase CpaA
MRYYVMSPWLLPTIAVLVASTGAITDLHSGRIPNKLTFSAMLLGIAGHSLVHGIAGVFESVVGVVVCAAVPGVVYKASQGKGIGGGDIKLFAALGALLGPMQGLEVELSAFLLLGVYAMFRLAYLGQLSCTIIGSLRVMAGLFAPKSRQRGPDETTQLTSMRMGPAIAVAVLTVLSLPQILRWMPWLG